MTRKFTGDRLLVATHNKGKLEEMENLLSPLGVTVVGAAAMNLPEPAETEDTFVGNARIKAHAAAKATGLPALSDNSGLCVDALEGAPGVYTADWAEREDGSRDFPWAMEKVEKALAEKGATTENRTARFVSVLCLAWPDGHTEMFRGEVEGVIAWPPRGDKGFGYDPIFQPEGYDKTFGELSSDEKHGWKPGDATALSHRARAFKLFVETCLTA